MDAASAEFGVEVMGGARERGPGPLQHRGFLLWIQNDGVQFGDEPSPCGGNALRRRRHVARAEVGMQAELAGQLQQHRAAERRTLHDVEPSQSMGGRADVRCAGSRVGQMRVQVGQIARDPGEPLASLDAWQQLHQRGARIQAMHIRVQTMLHTQESGIRSAAAEDVQVQNALVQAPMRVVGARLQALRARRAWQRAKCGRRVVYGHGGVTRVDATVILATRRPGTSALQLAGIDMTAAFLRQVDVAVFGLRGVAGGNRPVRLGVRYRAGGVDVIQDAALLGGQAHVVGPLDPIAAPPCLARMARRWFTHHTSPGSPYSRAPTNRNILNAVFMVCLR